MRLKRDVELLVVREYLLDFDAEAAGRRVGILRSPAYFVRAILERPRVKVLLAAEIEARRVRARIDADLVLHELTLQLGRLRQQHARLEAMLSHDLSEVYSETGELMPVQDWPEPWRRGLVTQVETEDTYEYSQDGEQAESAKAWDKSGRVTKLKRESQLDIERSLRENEKEQRECLKEIGRHTHVRAFPVPDKQVNINVTISAEDQRRLAAAEKRMRVIETSATLASDDPTARTPSDKD